MSTLVTSGVDYSMQLKDPKRVHREEFWGQINREEILLHDNSAWQKISQLEENSSLRKTNEKTFETLRKRESKAACKLVDNILKRSSRSGK